MNLKAEIKAELWDAISKPYESGVYSSAVLEAIHYLSNVLRERANVDGDGIGLVGQALGGDNPRLRINKFQTETEKNEQKGLEQILRGLYQGIRNPRSHEQFSDSQSSANAIILFIDYLLGIVSQAKQPFSIDVWCTKVFDKDFVPSKRYANLLVEEVPLKKRAETLIMLYRQKLRGDGEKLRYVFDALIALVGEGNLSDFLAVVSDELKITPDDNVIKTVFQILPPSLWPKLDEAARLRIENKIILLIESGKYDALDDSCESGWLATWARDYFKYFTVKNQLCHVLQKKLQGDTKDIDYVGKFFFYFLPNAVEESDPKYAWYQRQMFVGAIVRSLSDPFGAVTIREGILGISSFPSDWQDQILSSLQPLKETEPDLFRSITEAIEIPF